MEAAINTTERSTAKNCEEVEDVNASVSICESATEVIGSA